MKKIIALAFLVSVISCKKSDSSNNTTSPTKENLVGTYKQTGETYNGTNVWGGSSGYYQACEMDDTYQLKSDETYAYTDAGTTCSVNGSYNGTWSVSGTTFTMDGTPLTIQSFNGTTLVLKESWVTNGQDYNIVSTYTKQ
jgi:hypothetical protein